jgi:hypothetical protein
MHQLAHHATEKSGANQAAMKLQSSKSWKFLAQTEEDQVKNAVRGTFKPLLCIISQ